MPRTKGPHAAKYFAGSVCLSNCSAPALPGVSALQSGLYKYKLSSLNRIFSGSPQSRLCYGSDSSVPLPNLHKCLGVGHFYPCSGVGFCPTVIIHANTGGIGNTRVISRQSRPKIQILPDFFTQPERTRPPTVPCAAPLWRRSRQSHNPYPAFPNS